MEVFPDVADPWTGLLFAYTRRAHGSRERLFEPGGGTSMASPLFAAAEADAIQGRGGVDLGFANPTLFGLYGSRAFNDVTDAPHGVTEAVALNAGGSSAQLGTMGQSQLTGLSAGPGFDDVTGLGTPSAHFFAMLDG
jgi:subtilase family serine protease